MKNIHSDFWNEVVELAKQLHCSSSYASIQKALLDICEKYKQESQNTEKEEQKKK